MRDSGECDWTKLLGEIAKRSLFRGGGCEPIRSFSNTAKGEIALILRASRIKGRAICAQAGMVSAIKRLRFLQSRWEAKFN